SLSPAILRLSVADVMNFAVEFDPNLQFGTVEIELVTAPSVLSPKFAAQHFPPLEHRPQHYFRLGHTRAGHLPPGFVIGPIEVLRHGAPAHAIWDQTLVHINSVPAKMGLQRRRHNNATRPPLPPLPKGGRT